MSEGESGLREKREEGDEVGKIDSVTVVLFSRLSTVKSTGNSFREGTGIDSRGSNFYGSPNGVNIVSFSVDFCVMLATAVSLFLWTHVRTHTHTHTYTVDPFGKEHRHGEFRISQPPRVFTVKTDLIDPVAGALPET